MLQALREELDDLAARQLARRRRTVDGPHGTRLTVDGRELLAFCSNDYLGLAAHPALIAAAQDAAARLGVGAGASHLITGHNAAHAELEAALAEFTGQPRALLFSTGYMANLGVVTALAGREDAVFADRLNHASLVDACLLSRAKLHRYPHADMAALERQLAASRARRRLVATDAVFSMDGDVAPLPHLMELCERFDAMLLLDDAHGFGVLGREGRGTPDHFGIRSERLIHMGTLGKAAGVFGAFVAGAAPVLDWLAQRARTYVYTTALPPLLARTLLASLKLVRGEGEQLRDRLRARVAQFRGALPAGPWNLMPSYTPIQPLLVGDNAAALRLAAGLEARGILVPAIRPPTVPQGTARLRVSFSAAHTEGDVQRLVEALADAAGGA